MTSDSSVTITGDARTKSTVAAVWHDGTRREVAWLSADTAAGPWTPVPGAFAPELKLTEELAGHYLVAETTGAEADRERSAPLLVAHQDGNEDVDWLQKAGFGISHHILADWMNRVAGHDAARWQPGESWDDVLASFDVDAYVEQVAATGARFVLLTLGQNSGYLLGPNRVYDRIAGLAPGERTPTSRDLPREIGEALAAIGVPLMLYLPANPPEHAHRDEGDYTITDAFDPARADRTAPTPTTMECWQDVIREFSEHYGELVSGWWFDGVFPRMLPSYELTNPRNWSTMTAAAKAGNLRRVVTYNIGLDWDTATNPWLDYTSGELNELGPLPDGRWADEPNGVQWFALTYLGENDGDFYGWGNHGTSKRTEELVPWVSSVVARGGVVCLDTRVDRFGTLDAGQAEQLRAVGDALRSG